MLIGLTGGIASGKTTVSNMIRKMGLPIIDADEVAREVVEPGTETLLAISNHFGSSILNNDGTLARKKLGSVIFKSPEQRIALNEIIHPAIRKRMNELKELHMNNGAKTIVFDIPLLLESNLTYLVDKVLVVYVDESLQLARLMERDRAGLENAKQRIASQLPIEKKKQLADAVIDNRGTIQETEVQLKEIFKKWNVSHD